MKKIEKVVISLETSEREALGVIAGIICDSTLKCRDCPVNIAIVADVPHSICLSRVCNDILVRDNVQ